MENPAAEQACERQPLGEVNYRDLFQSVREGFFVGEVIRDENGRPLDFIFLEVNAAFTQQTRLGAADAIDRKVSELFPASQASLVEKYAAVVDTGKSAAFEVEVPALEHRCYEARAHPLGGNRFMVLFLDITQRKRMERELEESRALFSDIIESVDQLVWSTRPDGYIDFFNGRWYEYTGAEPGSTFGDDWAALFHPDDRERTFERWRRSLASGEPYEIEYRLLHRSSGEYRWVLGRAHPVRNEAGEIIRWMGTCTDIHEQKSFAEKLELAGNELSHRIKNIFAVISGLIGLSVRDHPQAQAFADEIRERIMALARAHDYARPRGRESTSRAEGATVLGLVGQLLSPYQLDGRDRIVIEGDDAPLNNRAATPISLALHELATNAAKYGGFSVPHGQVLVSGERFDGRFVLRWRERGGPTVREPERCGFGTRLVNVSLRDQLHAELVRIWHPEGLEVCLSAPADQLMAEG